MAMQSAKNNPQQNQSPQGQEAGRGSQREDLPVRRGSFALGFPFTPPEFFRMGPFAMMRRMSDEFDRMIGESKARGQDEKFWAPAVEVSQQGNQYIVRAELPGIKPEDVKLEVTEDAIVLQGERKEERNETRGSVHLSERRYGNFYRAIPLPEGAKAEDAQARFDNGVLEITVPAEEPKSRRREIPIQRSQAGSAAGANQAGKTGAPSEPGGPGKTA
jgi:HSP20 family protein